ncbi:MAG: FAD-dependent oxidoreductase [Anaerolineae bacterium]|nr:FAD-dependent oxidoreductase [Anaerolineae bacterium]
MYDKIADVLVVGAGVSGIPAAIGAARAGATVVLIEDDPVIGGATTDYFVDMFCGGPLTGILQEAHTLLKTHYSPMSDAYFFLPDSFQRVFWYLLAQEPTLSVITGVRVMEILREGQRVVGVRVATGLGRTFTIHSQITIDATGCGDVALMAGCTAMYGCEARSDFDEPHAPLIPDHHVQECTWLYISQKIGNGPAFDMMKLEHVHLGVLVNGLGWFHEDPELAMRLNPGIYLHWGCRVACADTRDSAILTSAQTTALRMMERDHALLREAGYAIYLAPRLGVRESNRIVGEHIITENDLRSRDLPADTIAVGTYGIDLWGGDENFPVEDRQTPAYGIPYRALVPRDVDGLLLAGKIISGSHLGMSAYRVMPIAGSIGQAAGVAAALCVQRRKQPRDLDAQVVRAVLRNQNQQLEVMV